jgi:hypothetical protein
MIYVRQSGAWQKFPTVPQGGRLLYFRINGQWKPILDVWVRNQGAWHKEPEYSAVLPAPTNLRMSTADVNNHTTIPVAWDYSGVLPPDDFHVVLTDEAGSWLWEGSAASGARSMTLGPFGQNKRYRVYIAARKAGRPDTAWAGPLNWFLGQDAYTAYDVPVYDWANEFEYIPPIVNYSSAANGDGATWGFQKALDGNFSSYWNTDIVSEPNGNGNQGEGWMVQAPSGHYLFTGVRLWNLNSHTCWVGVNTAGGWQGGLQPYVGKYAPWRINYAAVGGPGTAYDVRAGNYVTDAGGGVTVAGLMQNPASDGYNPRIAVLEVRLLLQSWTLIRYDPRTVPAVNSGFY